MEARWEGVSMPHNTRNRRPLWMRELESDLYVLRLNLADPAWSNLMAVSAALRPRIRLAWGVHSLGMALLRVSTRLDWVCPSSFEEFFQDGVRRGRRDVVRVLIKSETTTDVLGPLLLDLHMPAEDIVGHLTTTEVTR